MSSYSAAGSQVVVTGARLPFEYGLLDPPRCWAPTRPRGDRRPRAIAHVRRARPGGDLSRIRAEPTWRARARGARAVIARGVRDRLAWMHAGGCRRGPDRPAAQRGGALRAARRGRDRGERAFARRARWHAHRVR